MGARESTKEALDELARYGCIIPTEQAAAMHTAMPLKQLEAGVQDISLFGRFDTCNGVPYYIAYGFRNDSIRYFYSRDCVEWSDLLPSNNAKAGKLDKMLTGDAEHVYVVEEKSYKQQLREAREAAGIEVEGDEGEEGDEGDADVDGNAEDVPADDVTDEEEPEPTRTEVSELQYLYHLVQCIGAENSVTPRNAHIMDAYGRYVLNPHFAGLSHPDKLDAYTRGPGGKSLDEDFHGIWSVRYDSLKQTAVLMSLLWPGYFFFYSNALRCYKGVYFGNGLKNIDLPFHV